MENAIVTNVGGGGGDDASVATSRIRNHNSNSAMTPTSSARAYLASVIDTHCPMEVKYEDGATELFMLVEDANWEEVCTR